MRLERSLSPSVSRELQLRLNKVDVREAHTGRLATVDGLPLTGWRVDA